MTHSTYEFWEHGQSGAVFAVRLSADRRVTGCTGPLFSNQIRTVELPRYAYDDDPRELSWIERHRESWAPAGFIGAPYQ
jgi:hypothetical protein